MRLAAKSNRRRIPPEYPFSTRSAASTRSKRASSSLARARESLRPMSLNSPTKTKSGAR